MALLLESLPGVGSPTDLTENTDVFGDLAIGFLPVPLAVSKEKRNFAASY